jgi:hypothetical protein
MKSTSDTKIISIFLLAVCGDSVCMFVCMFVC